MFKIKGIEIIFALIISFFCINYFFSEKKVFEDLALGEETKRFIATDTIGNPIHIVEMSDDMREMLKGWEERGKKNVIFVLGNSQTHSINQLKPGDKTYISILADTFGKCGYDVLANSIPNASLQDFLLLYSYWKTKLPIKVLLVPIFMDDLREDGLRSDFYQGMIAEHFVLKDTQSNILKKINGEYLKFTASDDAKSSNEDTKALHSTTQEKTELFLNNWLDSNFAPWTYRATVRGEFFNSLYNFRNTVLGINASTIRKMIPARMQLNLDALSELLKDANKSGIKVIAYIPPIRHDLALPYDLQQYTAFKHEVKDMIVQNQATFSDLDSIVPGNDWGTKDATNASGKKEIDYMHFQYSGHLLIGKSLTKLINDNIKK